MNDSMPEEDPIFDEMLQSADPGKAPLDSDSIQRLTQSWQALHGIQASESAPNQMVYLSTTDVTPVPFRKGLILQSLAISAAFILVALGGLWLRLRLEDNERPSAQDQIAISNSDLNHQATDSDNSKRDSAPNKIIDTTPKRTDRINQTDPPKETTSTQIASNKPARVESIEDLLSMPKGEVRRYLKNGDLNGLKTELVAWLLEWNFADPAERKQLTAVWLKYHTYWRPWIIADAPDWLHEDTVAAAIEVMCYDQGNAAFTWIADNFNKPPHRQMAWRYMLQIGTDHQLVGLISECRDCDDLQALAMELARRDSVLATEVLAEIAATPGCERVLAGISGAWNPVHRSRALDALVSTNPILSLQAALLLSVMDDSQIDQILNQQVLQGRDRILATAVLMLRNTESSKKAIEEIRSDQVFAASLHSAVNQLQNWQRLQSSATSPRKEVCKKCVTTSGV